MRWTKYVVKADREINEAEVTMYDLGALVGARTLM